MNRNVFNSRQSPTTGTRDNEYENNQRSVNDMIHIYRNLTHSMRDVMTGYNNTINNYNQNISGYLSAINEYRNDVRVMQSQLFNNLPYHQQNILHTPINSARSSRTNTPSRPTRTRASNIGSYPVRTNVGNTESYTFSSPDSLFSNIFSFPINNLGTRTYEDVIVSPTRREIENAVEVFNYTENNTQNHHSCPITMEEFVINDRVSRIRHCGHTFREEAINNWFRLNVRCPVCRYDIREYTNNNGTIDVSNNDTMDVSDNDITDASDNTIDISNSSINTDDITTRVTNELTSLLTHALQSQLQSNMNSRSQYFSIDIPVSVTSTYENEYDEDDDDDL